jgi:phosphoribosylformylglycinamidine (FGAM) synthase PurS component
MAMHELHLSVGLKVTDNEARSALEAVQEKMGLRDRVYDLTREELWEITVEAARPADARETVERLVTTTNLFANPNKHKFALEEARDSASWASTLADDEVAVLVADREGTEGDSVLSAIHRIGVDDVIRVRRWTRWRIRLTEAPRSGDPEALALIRRIGVATGRRDGLLSNPHSQVSRAILPWGEEKALAA